MIIIIGRDRGRADDDDDDYHDFPTNSFPTFLGFQKSVLRFEKKENHQNLTPEIMNKSNQVLLLRCGLTGALILTQKRLNRAKTEALQGTKKIIGGSP